MLEDALAEWKDQIAQEARLEVRRATLLKLMTLRFGRLPKEARSRVERMTSDKELDRLTRKVLSANSLQDMGLG